MVGADGWQLSNYPILAGSAQLASLEIFQKTGIKALRRKSLLLTAYLYYLLLECDLTHNYFSIITPNNPNERGCQISMLIKKDGRKIFNALTKKGIIADWREPDVIRIAPVPLYNSFEDVFQFTQILSTLLK